MLAGIKLEFSFELTEPEFSSEIPKSSSVVSPVTVEVNAAVLPSLKHLQLHQNFHHNGRLLSFTRDARCGGLASTWRPVCSKLGLGFEFSEAETETQA